MKVYCTIAREVRSKYDGEHELARKGRLNGGKTRTNCTHSRWFNCGAIIFATDIMILVFFSWHSNPNAIPGFRQCIFGCQTLESEMVQPREINKRLIIRRSLQECRVVALSNVAVGNSGYIRGVRNFKNFERPRCEATRLILPGIRTRRGPNSHVCNFGHDFEEFSDELIAWELKKILTFNLGSWGLGYTKYFSDILHAILKHAIVLHLLYRGRSVCRLIPFDTPFSPTRLVSIN